MKNQRRAAIFILRLSDEMRHPYDVALLPLGHSIHWCASFDELTSTQHKEEALAIIVDLDCLPEPVETKLEKIRGVFPTSDLITLSSYDSAQLAVRCLRLGVTEFLLNPVSPEELAWSVRKCHQSREILRRLDPKTALLNTVTRISGSSAPNIVRLTSLEFLKNFLGAEGASWFHFEGLQKRIEPFTWFPAELEKDRVRAMLPKSTRYVASKSMTIKAPNGKLRKSLFFCKEKDNGFVLVWGSPDKITSEQVSYGRAVMDHSEQSLENLKKYDEIKHLTFVDDLTSLYNSRYLKYALTTAISQSKKNQQSFSVLFIDVDHFKTVNDGKGHLVGSEFLIAIAKTIKHAVRTIDPVFRYGGDEFVVILQGTPLEEARSVGERIRKNVERRIYVIKGYRMQTTVSIGIATYPDHTVDREALLKLADEAMYTAKKISRNAVHLAYGLNDPLGSRLPSKSTSNS